MSARHAERKASLFFEIALVLVFLDHVASIIVNANHNIVASGFCTGVLRLASARSPKTRLVKMKAWELGTF